MSARGRTAAPEASRTWGAHDEEVVAALFAAQQGACVAAIAQQVPRHGRAGAQNVGRVLLVGNNLLLPEGDIFCQSCEHLACRCNPHDRKHAKRRGDAKHAPDFDAGEVQAARRGDDTPRWPSSAGVQHARRRPPPVRPCPWAPHVINLRRERQL